MPITRYLPQWLQIRLRKRVPPPTRTLSKKDRQVLPLAPKLPAPPVRAQDDDSPSAMRLLWRI